MPKKPCSNGRMRGPDTYFVTWEIEVDADTPREAAELALQIQRDPASLAVVFDVWKEDSEERQRIDLLEEDIKEGEG